MTKNRAAATASRRHNQLCARAPHSPAACYLSATPAPRRHTQPSCISVLSVPDSPASPSSSAVQCEGHVTGQVLHACPAAAAPYVLLSLLSVDALHVDLCGGSKAQLSWCALGRPWACCPASSVLPSVSAFVWPGLGRCRGLLAARRSAPTHHTLRSRPSSRAPMVERWRQAPPSRRSKVPAAGGSPVARVSQWTGSSVLLYTTTDPTDNMHLLIYQTMHDPASCVGPHAKPQHHQAQRTA